VSLFEPPSQPRVNLLVPSVSDPLLGRNNAQSRELGSRFKVRHAQMVYQHGWTGYTGLFGESFHRIEFNYRPSFNKNSTILFQAQGVHRRRTNEQVRFLCCSTRS